jgi:hypothetical protein
MRPGTLRYWYNSTGEGVSSVCSPGSFTRRSGTGTNPNQNCCNWLNTTAAPYSVTFYDNEEVGYETDAELEAVLDTWVGTYLYSRNSEPDLSYNGQDYLVTSVSCA